MLRLKEIYSNVSQDKERLAEENRRLRALLQQNGTPGAATGGSGFLDDSMSNPSVGGYASSVSASGAAPASSHTSAFTPPPLSARSGVSPSTGHPPGSHQHQHSGQGHGGTGLGIGGQPNRNPNMDYDQAGIDFVLTYE